MPHAALAWRFAESLGGKPGTVPPLRARIGGMTTGPVRRIGIVGVHEHRGHLYMTVDVSDAPPKAMLSLGYSEDGFIDDDGVVVEPPPLDDLTGIRTVDLNINDLYRLIQLLQVAAGAVQFGPP